MIASFIRSTSVSQRSPRCFFLLHSRLFPILSQARALPVEALSHRSRAWLALAGESSHTHQNLFSALLQVAPDSVIS